MLYWYRCCRGPDGNVIATKFPAFPYVSVHIGVCAARRKVNSEVDMSQTKHTTLISRSEGTAVWAESINCL